MTYKIDKGSIAISAFVFLYTYFSIMYYCGEYLYGNTFWLLWPSSYFGVPDSLHNILNLNPFFKNEMGWDGQYYYYISNDLFGIHDFNNYVDAPSYRWQRIGLPLLAKIFSSLTFSSVVTSTHYLLTNIFLISIASYFLASFLKKNSINVLYVLPWALSLGVQVTVTNGLVDAAADSLFILAFIALLEKRYRWYVFFMTLTALTREGYLVFGFVIFLLSFFAQIEKDKKYNIMFSSLFAIPGIIFIAWYTYVSIHFHAIPATQAHGMASLFLSSFFKHFFDVIDNYNALEIFSSYLYIITISLVLYQSYIVGQKNKIYLGVFFYAILIGCLGIGVMGYYRDFLKALTIFLVIIPLMSHQIYGKIPFLIKIFLLINLIFSIALTPQTRGQHFPPPAEFRNDSVKNMNLNFPLKSFKSSIKVLSIDKNIFANIPLQSIFVKDYTIVKVKVKNLGIDVWSKNNDIEGKYGVSLSYHWYKKGDLNKVILDGFRSAIPRNIKPNEEFTSNMIVKYPEQKGDYILRITLVQEGVAWFYGVGGAYEDIDMVIN